jgi:formylglycine-generating enzyme required for sulfatase activity
MNLALPSDFPAAWASAWGQDRFGLWQAFTVKGVTQVLRWIPGGTFMMGSPEKEADWRFADETRHEVTLSQGYWLADTACTQALWRVVLDEAPSRFEGDERPVESVSWDDVVGRFLPELNRLVHGLEAVLPTEAQWEYACRAGTTTPFFFGKALSTEQANYDGNFPYGEAEKGEYRQETVAVQALPANAWGLYQMHGNVREWCADWLGEYPHEAVVDPTGPDEGRGRVLRGGGWIGGGIDCRSANRIGFEPGGRVGFGFRLVRAGGVGVRNAVSQCPAGSHAPAWEPYSDAPASRLHGRLHPGRWSVQGGVPTLERGNQRGRPLHSVLQQGNAQAATLPGLVYGQAAEDGLRDVSGMLRRVGPGASVRASAAEARPGWPTTRPSSSHTT